MSSNHTFSNVAYERYALALYELAKEKSELDKTEIEANNINQLINSCDEFKNMISNPTIGHKEQSAAVLKIADIYNFSSTFKKFLGFLTSKRRLFFLDKIIENFLNLISKNKGELKAYLFSSKKLSQQEVDLIQKDLSDSFASNIKLNYKYEPNLIGGLIIQVGSLMIDTSIKSKLKRLETSMLEEWYAN